MASGLVNSGAGLGRCSRIGVGCGGSGARGIVGRGGILSSLGGAGTGGPGVNRCWPGRREAFRQKAFGGLAAVSFASPQKTVVTSLVLVLKPSAGGGGGGADDDDDAAAGGGGGAPEVMKGREMALLA